MFCLINFTVQRIDLNTTNFGKYHGLLGYLAFQILDKCTCLISEIVGIGG